jgi:hypothetical protein
MNPSSRVVVTLMASFLPAFAACSGGGGGGGGGPQIPASVPAGSGGVTIQMAGTWQLGNVAVVETNSMLAPTPDGTQFVIGPTALLSIGGLSVAQGDLEALIGVALEAYVNQVDGRTLQYGVIVDQRATGGVRDQVAVAAGSVNDNTIAVEGFISTQGVNDVDPRFVRWRGVLSRVSNRCCRTPAATTRHRARRCSTSSAAADAPNRVARGLCRPGRTAPGRMAYCCSPMRACPRFRSP